MRQFTMNASFPDLWRRGRWLVPAGAVLLSGCVFSDPPPRPDQTGPPPAPARQTEVAIVGENFYLNGKPTYAGRTWNGQRIEGLLLNSRMVQGIFDDRNPETRARWAYPDAGAWDPERNTREFLAAMPEWRRHGLLAFTINLQGGSPEGYSNAQPWHNSGIEADGSLRPDYLARLERILDKADELGMVVLLGYFYFGQDQRLRDEAAVIRAADNITQWILDRGYRHVLVEINNECNVRYDHPILQPRRVHELIAQVKNTRRNGRRLLVGTSYGGGTVPLENVVRTADFLLIHGNGVSNPDRIAEMVRQTRAVPGFCARPVVFNEDDRFDFDKPRNNFLAALSEHASWGYFDPGRNNYQDGYQSPPVNWGLNTDRKRAFFQLVAEITGSAPAAALSAANPVKVTTGGYHGWRDAMFLSNGKARAVVVPAVGRVMQFGFAGEEGVFWENRALDGCALSFRDAEWREKDWVNVGGDKSWPAPEAEWPNFTQRKGWRPPPAFDGMPFDAKTTADGGVVLTSAVDPFFGVRVQRTVHLDSHLPVMTITTTYEKVSGEPAKIGVWVVTQFKDPLSLYAPVPPGSAFSEGYTVLGKVPPPSLKAGDGLLSLTRDPKVPHKIGNDAGMLLWVGERTMCRLEAPRAEGAEHPDRGCSAEVYTNPDPLRYIELEMLGPLQLLKAGDRISRTSTYTLLRRSAADPETDARRALGLPAKPAAKPAAYPATGSAAGS
jgi:hypothetical protein